MAAWTSQRSGNWSDDAANASSPWNGGGNPASGVPANTDTVTVAGGHDVAYDYDMSGFAAGITLTITGTLHASTTAGSYVLKLQANMTGVGTLRAGTSGTPYPTNCTFEIQRGGFQITATNMTLDLNCSEPTTKYIRLSGVEAAGQTVLSVDTDVTGEAAYWADGAIIRIDDINKGADSEERIIAAGGVAAGTITITAGLTAQKETGALVILISRNVKITHTSNSGNAINGATNGRIYASIRGVAVASNAGIGNTFGGTISNGTTGLNAESGATLNGVASAFTNAISNNAATTVNNAVISGCSSAGFNAGLGVLIINSLISGCVSGLAGGSNIVINSTINGCTNGVNTGNNLEMSNVILSNNTNDLLNVNSLKSYNTTFSSVTEFSGYTGTSRNITAFVESINHDATANAYKAWCRGGIVTSNVVTVYGTRPRSYQHACESASYYVFRNYSVTVEASGGLVVQCYVRKDAAMAYLPRVWILLPGVEPFISGSPDYEDIMTDSIDTWEELNLVYANGGTSPVTVTVRTLAKNAANNVYFDPIITPLAPATYDVYNTLLGYVDTIESRLPAALVGGRMDSSVGAMANNTLTAAAVATDAIDADALAADAVTEIQAGLATAASIAALNNLSAQQVWEYVTRTLTASSDPTAAAIVTQLLTTTLEGRQFQEIVKDLWAQVVGDFLADDATDPTSITYDGPDGATQITHTLTDTTRTVS